MDLRTELGENDTWLQKGLRVQGRMIGTHPIKWCCSTCVISLVIIIVGWTSRETFGGSKPVLNPMTTSMQWALKGGDTEKNTKFYNSVMGMVDKDLPEKKTEITLWNTKDTLTMYIAKDTAEKDQEEAGDVLTVEALTEIYNMHLKWTDVNFSSVTVAGNLTYTMWDLCSRGMLPDLPPGVMGPGSPRTPYMPCDIISPLQCFREAGHFADPMYQYLDSNVTLLAATIPGSAPYSTRPSLLNSTTAQVKQIVSTAVLPAMPGADDNTYRGCQGEMTAKAYIVEMFAGGVEWSNGTITKAKALRNIHSMDGVKRIQYRMSLTKGLVDPRYMLEANIEEAQRIISKRWAEYVHEYTKTTQHAEIAALEDLTYYTLPMMEEEMSDTNGVYFVMGFLLMAIFCCAATMNLRHPAASRATIGFFGLCMIGVAIASAFGFFFMCDFYMNPAIFSVMPLLALGIGVDDMFIFLRYFSQLGVDFIKLQPPDAIIGEVLASAGPGATLTSMCNALAFFVGAFLPIRGMADFCVCGAFVAVVNYLVMVNLFMPLVTMEIDRIKNDRADPHPFTYFWHKTMIKKDQAAPESKRRGSLWATSSDMFTKSFEKRFKSWLRDVYAPILCSPIVSACVSLVGLAFFAVSIVLISNASLGWGVADLFPGDSPAKKPMQWIFSRFTFFPAELVIHDLDIAAHQKEISQLYGNLTMPPSAGGSCIYAMPFPLPPFYSLFAYIMFVGTSAAVAEQMAPMAPMLGAGFQDAVTNQTLTMMMMPPGTPGMGPAAIGLDMSYTHPQFAPFGTVTSNSTYFTQFMNTFRWIPPNPADAWDPAKQMFIYGDAAGMNQFRYDDPNNTVPSPMNRINFAGIPYFLARMPKESIYIDAIKEIKATMEKSPLKDNAFVYSAIINFWEVFEDLKPLLHYLIIIDACIIFVVALVFFTCDFITAILTCMSCTMIVLELYGLAVSMMNFNIFVAALSLMAMGMSVEFTVHLAAAFSLGEGEDVADRLGTSLSHTVPALLEGSASTFLGVLPLAFHPIVFMVKYFFIVLSLTVAIGMLNGLIFMPAMLGLIGPLLKYVKCKKENAKVVDVGTVDAANGVVCTA